MSEIVLTALTEPKALAVHLENVDMVGHACRVPQNTSPDPQLPPRVSEWRNFTPRRSAHPTVSADQFVSGIHSAGKQRTRYVPNGRRNDGWNSKLARSAKERAASQGCDS